MTQVILMALVVAIIGCWFCQDVGKLRRRLNRRVRVGYSRYQQTRHKEA